MTNDLANKHDAAFKEIFGQVEIAKDFIKNAIPQEALEIINLESLELIKDSFINEDLKESFSDLIYRVKINKREAYISFLLEHKSYPDKLAIFQINKYILEAWITKIQKENKKELPVIIPILIYHGRGAWNYKTDIRDMIGGYYNLPQYYKERLPVFKHDLENIGQYKESDFNKLRRLTAMMVKAFKYAFEKNPTIIIREFLLDVEEVGKEESQETLIYHMEIYLKYMTMTNEKITEEAIKKEIEKLEGKGRLL